MTTEENIKQLEKNIADFKKSVDEYIKLVKEQKEILNEIPYKSKVKRRLEKKYEKQDK